MPRKPAVRPILVQTKERARSGICFELTGFEAFIAAAREAVRLDLEEARAQEGGAA